MEGTACNGVDPAPSPPCNDPSLTLPVHEYPHGTGDARSSAATSTAQTSALYGHYFFGDYCTGHVWSLRPGTLELVDRTAELGAAAGVGLHAGRLRRGRPRAPAARAAHGRDDLSHLLGDQLGVGAAASARSSCWCWPRSRACATSVGVRVPDPADLRAAGREHEVGLAGPGAFAFFRWCASCCSLSRRLCWPALSSSLPSRARPACSTRRTATGTASSIRGSASTGASPASCAGSSRGTPSTRAATPEIPRVVNDGSEPRRARALGHDHLGGARDLRGARRRRRVPDRSALGRARAGAAARGAAGPAARVRAARTPSRCSRTTTTTTSTPARSSGCPRRVRLVRAARARRTGSARAAATRVVELDWWQSAQHGRWTITCLPSQHWSRRIEQGVNESLWCAWLLDSGERRYFFAGDTGYFARLRRVRPPLRPDRRRAAADRRLRAALVHALPAHGSRRRRARRSATSARATWWPCTGAPSTSPTSRSTSRRRRWRRAVSAAGADPERFRVLAIGETWHLPD